MGGIHEISGQCHCGNIEYHFYSPIPKLELPIKGCDCSFCTRQGASYTSHPQGQLKVQVHDQALVKFYRFGSEAADVFLCTNCGVFPFVTAELDGNLYAVLNANSINGLHLDRSAVLITPHLENQSVQERISRWKRSWIPHVEISYLKTPVNPALL